MDRLAAFADQVEKLVSNAEPEAGGKPGMLSWESFHEPLINLITRHLLIGAQQAPEAPGKIRIDMGAPLPDGGLKRNPHTVLILDFDWLDGDYDHRFIVEYNLADELIRYAEVGEGGWDIARQIDQLERTILQLRKAAEERDWPIPHLAPDYDD
jgi:hypothetical protein